MNEIISKTGISRSSFFSFIVLCCVFAGENAYGRFWMRSDMEITYDKTERSFILKYLVYDFKNSVFSVRSFAEFSDLSYSEDGTTYNRLILLFNDLQDYVDDVLWLRIGVRTSIGKLEFPGSNVLPQTSNIVETKITETRRKDFFRVKSKTAYVSVKWSLPESVKRIHSFKIQASWVIFSKNSKIYKINEIYQVIQDKTNSNVMRATKDKVNVTVGTDAIIVKGAERGENIKVCSFSGIEVKSVVANDDVVKIEIPKNQKYVIKIAQKGYKVVL